MLELTLKRRVQPGKEQEKAIITGKITRVRHKSIGTWVAQLLTLDTCVSIHMDLQATRAIEAIVALRTTVLLIV